jgi:flagellar biosynthetic protein FliQ
MNQADVIQVIREAIVLMITISAPVLLVALIVGVSVSLVQALTQIQEMTLTFVPKILAMLAALIIFMPMMLNSLTGFMERLADKIATLP